VLYLHFATAMGARPQVPGAVWLLTGVIFVFGVIIAWFKDLPDTEGDAEYGIRTLTLVRSRQWVYRMGGLLLAGTLLLAGAIAWWHDWRALAIGLLLLLGGFGLNAARLDLSEQASIARFYQGTWVVFFGVYLLFAVWG
ncbi:MAG: UbiA family prenyltransferase, partial [Bacteroidota bacterium]